MRGFGTDSSIVCKGNANRSATVVLVSNLASQPSKPSWNFIILAKVDKCRSLEIHLLSCQRAAVKGDLAADEVLLEELICLTVPLSHLLIHSYRQFWLSSLCCCRFALFCVWLYCYTISSSNKSVRYCFRVLTWYQTVFSYASGMPTPMMMTTSYLWEKVAYKHEESSEISQAENSSNCTLHATVSSKETMQPCRQIQSLILWVHLHPLTKKASSI